MFICVVAVLPPIQNLVLIKMPIGSLVAKRLDYGNALSAVWSTSYFSSLVSVNYTPLTENSVAGSTYFERISPSLAPHPLARGTLGTLRIPASRASSGVVRMLVRQVNCSRLLTA
jgi:hypothetical protein